MNKKIIPLAVAGGVALAGLGAFGASEAFAKDLTVAVEGQQQQVRTYGDTVGDVLAQQKVTVGEHDLVVPSLGTKVSDGTQITIRYGRPVTLEVDGKKEVRWTTATTVDEALQQLAVRTDGAKLSTSRSASIGREGVALSITTPATVTVVAPGGTKTVEVFGTVADALKAAGVATTGVKITPALTTPVTDGLQVSVVAVTTKNVTKTVEVPFTTKEKKTDSLLVGETDVTVEGRNGKAEETWQQTLENGKVVAETKTATKVVKAPRTEIVRVGTKTAAEARAEEDAKAKAEQEAKAKAEAEQRAEEEKAAAEKAAEKKAEAKKKAAAATSADEPAPSTSAGGPYDLRRMAMWKRIAYRESRCNPHVVNKSSMAGGYVQFMPSTWRAMGGTKYAPYAHLATLEQQITIANKLYDRAGYSPWAGAPAPTGSC